MDKVEIDTHFGNTPTHVELSTPTGAGGSFQVVIDKYYNGSLIKTERYGWQVHLHSNTILQGDDVAVIIELIETNLNDLSWLLPVICVNYL
jgi:hypothetical protein